MTGLLAGPVRLFQQARIRPFWSSGAVIRSFEGRAVQCLICDARSRLTSPQSKWVSLPTDESSDSNSGDDIHDGNDI